MKFKIDNLEVELASNSEVGYERLRDGTISVLGLNQDVEIGVRAPFTTLGSRRSAIDGLSCDIIIGNYVYRFMHLNKCNLNRAGEFHKSGMISLGNAGNSGMTKGRVMLRIQVIFLGKLKKDVNLTGIERIRSKRDASRAILRGSVKSESTSTAGISSATSTRSTIKGLHRQANMLIDALRADGYPDNSIATITGVMAGESGLYFLTEKPWTAENLINMKHGRGWGGINPASYPLMRRNLSRFTDSEIRQKAKDPKWSFSIMYAGNNKNGSFESGDGYKFRGRGPIQLTGRGNYQAFADWMGDSSIVRDPDSAFKRDEVNVKSVLWFLKYGNGSKFYSALRKGRPVTVAALASIVVGGDSNFRTREIAARRVASLMATA